MEHDETRLLSQSALQDFVDCRRLFKLRHLEQLPYPAVDSEPAVEHEARRVAGEAFHHRVQQFWLGIPPGKLQVDPTESEVNGWWETFARARLELEVSQPRAELALTAKLHGTWIVAKYDLVGRGPDDRIRIFDWKTSRRPSSVAQLSSRLQTRVYRAVMVAAGAAINAGKPVGPEQVELVYWFRAGPGEAVSLPYDTARHQEDIDVLGRILSEIHATASYPPTNDISRCAVCEYRSFCERGIGAGTGTGSEPSPDRALPAMDELDLPGLF